MLRSIRRRLVAATLGVALLGVVLAAPASARFVASGTDAADAADGGPAHDLIEVGIAYDRRTGRLEGGTKLRGTDPAAAPAQVELFAGMRTPAGCQGYPAIGFVTRTDGANADWLRLNRPNAVPAGRGAAHKDYEGAVETYAATSPSLRGLRPQCVIARLANADDPTIVYDVAGPYTLKRLPELELSLGRVPAMEAEKPRKVRVTLRNVGDAATGRLRLQSQRARGLTVMLPKRVASIKAGKLRRVTARVRISSRAKGKTKLRITAKGPSKLQAQGEDTIYKIVRRGSSSGGGGGGSDGPKLCYRYTWMPPYGELVPC